jgi:hypothetical protein
MALTYTQLSTAIQEYCETDETSFVANIPVFVKQAEDRILNAVQLPVFRKTCTSLMTTGNQYLATPDAYLSPYSFSLNNSGYEFLNLKDVSYIREMYPDSAVTGTPRFYAIRDSDTFILGPTPDANYPVELNYFYRPASIVDSATSWLGTNAESCLLYACLVEAYTYLKGDADVMTMYLERYKEALADLKELGEGFSQTDEYRAGTPRVQRG